MAAHRWSPRGWSRRSLVMPPITPAERFSDRVSDYVRTRPGYPSGVFDLLRDRCGLRPGWVVADIGAGTGIATRYLLDAGATVHAVEPNEAMRGALVGALGNRQRLHVHARCAEDTGLPGASIDLIVAAQAFHWFDRTATRHEFERILKPHRWVAIVWNTRLADTTPFLAAYEQMLRHWATDYETVSHRNLDIDAIAAFFAPHQVERHTFALEQVFDLEGVRGRLMSSSYAPAPGHPHNRPMIAELDSIFDAYNEGGYVRFQYETECYLGQLTAHTGS
jgi:SAM-dependent methyltransferase